MHPNADQLGQAAPSIHRASAVVKPLSSQSKLFSSLPTAAVIRCALSPEGHPLKLGCEVALTFVSICYSNTCTRIPALIMP
eukprot:1154045-Pelagomonas_calceolata.AAC.9